MVRPIEAVVIGPLGEYGNGDLSAEVAQAKAVMLYADSVAIASHRPTFLLARMINRTRRLPDLLTQHPAFLDEEFCLQVHDGLLNACGPQQLAVLSPVLEALRQGDPGPLLGIPEVVSELLRESKVRPADDRQMFRTQAEIAVKNWINHDPAERTGGAYRAVQDLVRLLDAEVVTVGLEPLDRLMAAELSNVEAELARVIDRTVAALIEASARAHPVIVSSIPEARAKANERAVREANRTALAARLLSDIPNLAALPVDELLDVRGAVTPYLARFRAAVAELEDVLEADFDSDDFDEAVDEVKRLKVDPELEELRQSLADTGATAAAVRAAPIGVPAAVTLGVSALLGGPALFSAAAVAAGVAGAAARELLFRNDAEAQRRKHRLFLLFDVERRVAP